MLKGYLVGESAVVARLDGLGPKLREELMTGVGRATLKLQRMVKRDKLNGLVLGVRTGTLRRSIDQDQESRLKNPLEVSGDRITGIVSTNVKYAKAHEYGFSGVVSVREHMRTVKQAFGRPIAPREVTVRAHTMKMNLPERSFLRSALADLESQGILREELEAAIKRATAD